jgi:hypothetical protein
MLYICNYEFNKQHITMNIRPHIIVILIFFTFWGSGYSQKLSLLTEGGFSYRLMMAPDSITDSYYSYFQKKKTGSNLGIELVWFTDDQGFGIKYASFLNSVSESKIEFQKFNRINKSEKIQIDYYSMQYHARKQLKKSRLFIEFSGGLGLVRYYNEATEQQAEFSIAGKSYGMNGTLSFDYVIHRNVSVFFSTQAFLANLNEQTRNGFTEILNPKESLSRIDFNGGIRISLYTFSERN